MLFWGGLQGVGTTSHSVREGACTAVQPSGACTDVCAHFASHVAAVQPPSQQYGFGAFATGV